MRYFRIHDELSDEHGDLYKWDGTHLRMLMHNGQYSDHTDAPSQDETLEQMLTHLAGIHGTWEEVGCPEK